MKIAITFKDPDGVSTSIREAVTTEVEQIEGLSEDEREELIESRSSETTEALKQWIEYGEYLRVDFDTMARTATVKKNS